MLVIGGKWEGADNLGAEALAEIRPEAEQRVRAASQYLAGQIKVTLTGQRSGRVYRVPGTKRATYTASAPGEPPAVMLGNLLNSVGASAPKWDGGAVSAEVGPGLGATKANTVAENYAQRLEWGGTDSRGVHIAKRPYMEPTVIREQAAVERILEGA